MLIDALWSVPLTALTRRGARIVTTKVMKQIHSLYQVSEKPLSRRSWLRAAGCGFGYLSLSALLADEFKALPRAQDNPLAPRQPHFEPKAKRVIFLFMHGGPSSIDTF